MLSSYFVFSVLFGIWSSSLLSHLIQWHYARTQASYDASTYCILLFEGWLERRLCL